MGTKIIEQGSTAGGIAKVQYLDESGNVLYEVNDSDKIFKMVNSKISGLAGTGNRIVVADSAGNLTAIQRLNVINVTGLTTSYQLTIIPAVTPLSYVWSFTSSTGVAFLESTHNLFIGNNVYSEFRGATVTEITPNTNYSFRLGDSVVEIGVDATNGDVYLKRNSGTVTDITISRITQNI